MFAQQKAASVTAIAFPTPLAKQPRYCLDAVLQAGHKQNVFN